MHGSPSKVAGRMLPTAQTIPEPLDPATLDSGSEDSQTGGQIDLTKSIWLPVQGRTAADVEADAGFAEPSGDGPGAHMSRRRINAWYSPLSCCSRASSGRSPWGPSGAS